MQMGFVELTDQHDLWKRGYLDMFNRLCSTLEIATGPGLNKAVCRVI